MNQTEIYRPQWKTFCDRFSRQHRCWIANLSVGGVEASLALEIEPDEVEQQMRCLSRSAPFQNLAVDPNYGSPTLSVTLGAPPKAAVYWIDDPLRLLFLRNAEGAHEGLMVENRCGQATLLRFRSAALPETLDGISEAERLLASMGTA